MKKIFIFSLFAQISLAQNAVEIANNSIRVISNSLGYGLHSTSTGSFGTAGVFENTSGAGISSALVASNAGFGSAIYSTNFGIGASGVFQISNATSIATSLVARTNGLGSSGLFETTLNTNTKPTLSSLSNSNNYTFQAINSGTGINGGTAGYFENSSASNFTPALIVKNNGGYNAASFSIDNISNSNDVIVATTTGTGSAARLQSNGSNPTLDIIQLGGGRGINSYSTGIAGYFNSSSSYSIITSSGNVGIGTITPDKAGLVVNTVVGSTPAIFGENTAGVGLDVAWPGISFNGYYNAGRKPLVDGFVGGMSMDPTNGLIRIYNSAASGTANTNISQFDRVYINNQGKVGIGVSSPDQLLDVNGRARIRHNTFTAGIWMSNSLNSTNGADGAFYGMKNDTEAGIYIGNAWRFSVNNAGNVSVGGTVTASCGVLVCSDLRYKKNITSLNNSLENILQINGVRYDFKREEFPERNFSDKNQIGFIAQEIEKLFPEMVFTDEKGYKSVDYAKFTPVLVEAIKELKKVNDELKSKNHSLENRLDKIEAMLSK